MSTGESFSAGDRPAARYALYFAPPAGSALWCFGSGVLGYDARTAERVHQIVPPGWPASDWHAATAEPRRYGFHATLKAPFRLATGTSEAELLHAVAEFGRTRLAAPLPGLEVAALGSFVALVPAGGLDALARLESEVVRTFDRFRAPLGEAERAKRKPDSLTERQRQALERWGYPFVLEDFRFHMTLTGPLPRDRLAATREALAEMAGACGATGPVHVDPIAVFRQSPGEEHFRMLPGPTLGQRSSPRG